MSPLWVLCLTLAHCVLLPPVVSAVKDTCSEAGCAFCADEARMICPNLPGLTYIPKADNPKKISFINVKACGISQLPEDALQQFPELETLNLGANQLTSLPKNLFRNNTKLKTLVLSNNKLTTLPLDIFRHNTALHRLNVQNNPLYPSSAGALCPVLSKFSQQLPHFSTTSHQSLDPSNCPGASVACYKTDGITSYYCKCVQGMTFDGTGCIAESRCNRTDLTQACNQYPTCQASLAYWEPATCSCPPGYQLTGNTCKGTGVNECVTGLHNCNTEGHCVDTYGSFSCKCKTGVTGSCAVTCPVSGYEWNYQLKRCVKLYKTPSTWTGADQQCAVDNGLLVEIRSATDNKALQSYATSQNNGQPLQYWIGLNDRVREGVWVWSNNATASYKNFKPGKPSGGAGANCAVALESGEWSDSNCEWEGFSILCELLTGRTIGQCVHSGKIYEMFVPTLMKASPWPQASGICDAEKGRLPPRALFTSCTKDLLLSRYYQHGHTWEDQRDSDAQAWVAHVYGSHGQHRGEITASPTKMMLNFVCVRNGDLNDINECTGSLQNCDSHATCRNTLGSYSCACNTGYTGTGTSCSDINECTGNLHNCDSNAACSNTLGSFSCACNTGYTGSGTSCFDIDECTIGSFQCPGHLHCANTGGSYTCQCNAGYTDNGATCTDTDECTSHSHSCSSLATCNNTVGSYSCSCVAGFTGTGTTCTAIGTFVAQCLESGVLHQMFVPPGMKASNWLQAVRKCSTSGGRLPPRALFNACTKDMLMSRHYQHPHTWEDQKDSDTEAWVAHVVGGQRSEITASPTVTLNFMCVVNNGNVHDINECTGNLHNCDSHAACSNTLGSFSCACNTGYTGTGTTCKALPPPAQQFPFSHMQSHYAPNGQA